ncbi:MAG: DUF6448 family protein [Gaiellaceae bacterium]
MPPHCDSLDGPVVRAARVAIETGDVDHVLPFVPAAGEHEIRKAFELGRAVRPLGAEARTLADTAFFETVVRVHRAGEGAPYTGLKPAGLDVGPVIPVAERAIETGSADELKALLRRFLDHEVEHRLHHLLELKPANGDVAAQREYVEAMLGLQVWAHSLYLAMHAQPHEHGEHSREQHEHAHA